MTVPRFPRPPTGVHSLLLASLPESPELVVPRKSSKPLFQITTNRSTVSTIPYVSKISQREEHLPFVVGIMGVPGMRLRLLCRSLGVNIYHRK